MIQGARARGLDITTEAYPYTAGMTDLASAIFSDGWQARQGGITFGDLQWAVDRRAPHRRKLSPATASRAVSSPYTRFPRISSAWPSPTPW